MSLTSETLGENAKGKEGIHQGEHASWGGDVLHQHAPVHGHQPIWTADTVRCRLHTGRHDEVTTGTVTNQTEPLSRPACNQPTTLLFTSVKLLNQSGDEISISNASLSVSNSPCRAIHISLQCFWFRFVCPQL